MSERLGRNPFAKKSQSGPKKTDLNESVEASTQTEQTLEGEIIELVDDSPFLAQIAPQLGTAVSILKSFLK